MRIYFLILSILLLPVLSLAQYTSGKGWEAKKMGDQYVLSMHNGTEIMTALEEFFISEKITAASFTGIGGVSQSKFRFFVASENKHTFKTFDEQAEIVNLTGNVAALEEGGMMVHVHCVMGDKDYQLFGGHLMEATIRGAGEFIIEPLDGTLVKGKNETGNIRFKLKK